MKFFFDLLPVLAFFVAFQIAGIYAATAVAIATTFVQVAWLKLRGKRVDAMLWASLVIIVVFGGATLILQDETFIKWKPTVLYWMLGVVLGGAALVFRRNLIRTLPLPPGPPRHDGDVGGALVGPRGCAGRRGGGGPPDPPPHLPERKGGDRVAAEH